MKKFKVDFSVKGMKRFVSFYITEIQIYQDQIPMETKELKIVLEDIDFKNLQHGKKTIFYEGNDILMRGTFKIFPLSPLFRPHRYQLSVYALDKDRKTIAIGKSVQQFPQE